MTCSWKSKEARNAKQVRGRVARDEVCEVAGWQNTQGLATAKVRTRNFTLRWKAIRTFEQRVTRYYLLPKD